MPRHGAAPNARARGDRLRGRLFSGLFGVGGGAIIVPMLVLRFGYRDRRAMGTSLVAIAVMAGAALMLVIAWRMVRERPRA